jgi:hypothetical protein
MNPDWTIIYLWLYTALFWIAVLMAVTGLLMVLLPGRMLVLNQKLDIWIDTSRWFRLLDEPHRVERGFYRHHVITGVLIIAGALYSLRYLWVLRQNELLLLVPEFSGPEMAEWVHAGLSLFLIAGNGIALLAGIIVLFRPSLLKGVEVWANTWVDSEKVMRKLDSRMEGTGRFISGHVRLLGMLVVIGSVYIMTNTITVLM